jgi:hypothetical protein
VLVLSLTVIPVCAIMVCGGMERKVRSFLASALDGNEWSASCCGHSDSGV